MPNSLSIASDTSASRVFPCPVCKQTIDLVAPKCRFCGATIDPVAAQAAADLMARINQACNDASYLKIAIVAGLGFIVVQFVPFVSLAGVLGYWFLTLAIPFWTIRWWIRFRKLPTDDSEFRRAKRTMIAIGIPVSLLLLAYLIDVVGGFTHRGAS